MDERSFVIFSQTGTLLYIDTAANGSPRPTKEPKILKLDFFGSNTSCQDVIPWGDNDELLVVGCVSKQAKAGTHTIWIQTVDRLTFKGVGKVLTYTLAADSDFRIFNKINLVKLIGTGAKGKMIPYLAVTDMGKSNKTKTDDKDEIIIIIDSDDDDVNPAVIKDNSHFLLFSYLNEEFEFDEEVKVTAGGKNTFDYVYEYFWFNNALVVTSKLKGVDVIQVSHCDFKITNKVNDIVTIDCDGSAAPTGISIGYFTQLAGNEDLWVAVDLSSVKTVDLQIVNVNNQIDNPQSWT